LRAVFRLALPIIMGSLIWPLMRFADTMLIHTRLMSAGFSADRATELFGQFSGQAGPLINLPSILTVALAASLVPSITAAVTRRDAATLRSQTNLAIKISLIIGLPAAVGLYMLGTPVASLLYNNPQAGPVIASYAWTILFLLLYQTSAAILQGAGKLLLPVVSMGFGVVTKAILTFILCGIPQLNVRGAGWATAIGMALAVGINLVNLYRTYRIKVDLRGLVLAPGAATTAMAVAIYFGYPFIATVVRQQTFLALGGTIAVAGFLYLVILVLGGCFRSDELLAIPRIGKGLIAVLKRFKLLRS